MQILAVSEFNSIKEAALCSRPHPHSILRVACLGGPLLEHPYFGPWALNYESGEGGGDAKGRRRGGEKRAMYV